MVFFFLRKGGGPEAVKLQIVKKRKSFFPIVLGFLWGAIRQGFPQTNRTGCKTEKPQGKSKPL